MAEDANANIRIDIDTTAATAALKTLQGQIARFHTEMARGGAVAGQNASKLQQDLINSINAGGQFQAGMTKVQSTTEAFTTALEKNKLSMGQYFRYAGASTKTFGRFFSSEFQTITKVATERVKDLQTQYVSMGRDANGALKAIKVRPLTLDMNNLATQTMITAQKQQLYNQLLKQGSTNLLNFGKNTQWAGRQLMVGFTLPLTLFASTAARSFMEIEKEIIKIRRVYGDFSTTVAETDKMIDSIKSLANEYTKYGVAVKDTLGLAAEAAAMGNTGQELLAQIAQATRLAVLGNVEQTQALQTTISLTNTFGTATEQLAGKIDFLNAVENQSVTSIEDLTTAIPKAGPVVQQLGGDVEDLAFFLTAMKEGGINASEGANALKSGLAALINPTGKAKEMLSGFGINIEKIVNSNKGDIKGLVIDFASALDTLDPLNRARAIEQLFGKFQFSRLSTLFQNVIGEGTQASRVLELTKSTTQELAILSQRELKKVEDTTTYKFEKAFADFQAALAPVGEQFLKAITPVIEFGTKLLNQFNNMGDGAKSFAVILTTVVAGVGPVLLMTVGLVANGVANLIKMFQALGGIFKRSGADTTTLGLQTDYMSQQQLEAAAVAASLNQSHSRLVQTFSVEAAALNNLTLAYQKAVTAQRGFAMPGGRIAGSATKPKAYAGGVVSVPGPKGKGDTVPAMLSPGEAVIPAAMAKKYGGLISGMIADNIPGYYKGFQESHMGADLNITDPKVIDQIEARYPGFKKLTPDQQALVAAKGNLTVTLPDWMNQDMRENVGPGINADAFNQEWNKTKGKLGKAAVVAGLDVSSEATRVIVQGFEDGIGKEAARLAKLEGTPVFDRHLDKAAETILGRAATSTNAAVSNAATKLSNQRGVVGTIRSNLPKLPGETDDAALKRLYKEGKLTAKEKGMYLGNTGLQVGRDAMPGSSGKNATAQQIALRQQSELARTAWWASGGDPNTKPVTMRGASVSSGSMSVGRAIKSYESVSDAQVAAAGMPLQILEESKRPNKETGSKIASQTAKQIADGAAAQAQTASPSRVTRKIGQDTAQGYINGLNQGQTQARKAGTRGVVSRPQGPAGTVPQIFQSQAERDARQQMIRERAKNAFGPKAKLSKIGGSIANGVKGMGGMGAGMGLAMAGGMVGSMVPGLEGLGTAASLAGTAMMMIPGPIGLVAAALVGLTTVTFALLQAKEAETQKSIDLAKAQVMNIDALQTMSEDFGTVSATEARKAKEDAKAAGISTKQLSAGEQYLTDMVSGQKLVADVKAQQAAGVSSGQIGKDVAANMATAVAQGVITKEQADGIIVGLGKLSGDRSITTNAVGQFGTYMQDPTKASGMVARDRLAQLQGQFAGATSTYATAAQYTDVAGSRVLTTPATSKTTITDPNAAKGAVVGTLNAYGQAAGGIDAINAQYDALVKEAKTKREINQLEKSRTEDLNNQKSLAADLYKEVQKQKIAIGETEFDKAFLASFDKDSDLYKTAEKITGLKNSKFKTQFEADFAGGNMSQAAAEALILRGEEGVTSHYSIIANVSISNQDKALLNRLDTSGTGDAGNEKPKKCAICGSKAHTTANHPYDDGSSSGSSDTPPEDKVLTKLQAKLDKRSKALNIISLQEAKINKKYDERKKALEEIAKINGQIAEQQQSQLDIADALSRGDIASAARAVQAERARAAAFAQEQQMKALEEDRQKSLGSITFKGMTRESLQAQIDKLNMQIALREYKKASGGGMMKGYAGGGIMKRYSAGGRVMSYFAGGGSPLGSDIIPAMLTPGEFVVKRPAVQNFGVKKLEAINSGKSSDASVYTYNVRVNVATNSDPDAIARTVVTKIRSVDKQRLGGNSY